MSARRPRSPLSSPPLFPFAGGPWPPTTTLSGFLPGLAAMSAWQPPTPVAFDMTAWSEYLELQRKVWQMWIDSAQTIALRFMLAPPWMAYSPWVREEWVRMVSEKVAASNEAMNVAVRNGMRPDGMSSKSLQRAADGMVTPFSTRTRSNANRLGSRVLSGEALKAAIPPAPGTGGLAKATRSQKTKATRTTKATKATRLTKPAKTAQGASAARTPTGATRSPRRGRGRG